MELLGLATPWAAPLSPGPGRLSMDNASVVSRVLPLPLNLKFSFKFSKILLLVDLKFKCKFFLLLRENVGGQCVPLFLS